MRNISKVLSVFMISCLTQQANGQAAGWFTKVTTDLGLQMTGIQIPSAVDVNNDDYPDIVTVDIPPGTTLYNNRKPIKVYMNIQDPSDASRRKFVDVTSGKIINTVPPDTGSHANCFTLADFNNDGNVDLVTGNFYYRLETYGLPNDRAQVFLGDGTGNFRWVPNNGLSDIGLVNVRALTALDYDKDGKLDLFIAAWFKDYSKNIFDHGYLLKGNGDGTFTNVTTTSGIGSYLEPMYGSAATDWNNDCRPDIFTAPYCRTGGKVFKNEGNGHFTDVAASVGYDLYRTGAGQAACTFSVIPEDVNNDGYMDCFFSVVHGGNSPGQFRSTIAFNKGPDHNYEFDLKEDVLPVSAPASPHRGDYDGAFLDFDNNGFKDLVMVQGTYMPSTDRTYFWMQNEDHTFREVTSSLQLLVPELKSTGAVDIIDFDMDGDDDIMIQTATGAMDIWKNNIGQDKSWVSVKLQSHGNMGNRNAIGARIYVYAGGKMQMKEIMAGRGQHTGQQPFILNFGLNTATKVDSIVVKWPDANCTKKTVVDPGINRMVTINSFPTDVAEIKKVKPELKVFPNPTEGYLILQAENLANDVVAVTVFDATGKSVNVIGNNSDGDKIVFDLSSLSAGMYFVNVVYKDGAPAIHKIIKN